MCVEAVSLRGAVLATGILIVFAIAAHRGPEFTGNRSVRGLAAYLPDEGRATYVRGHLGLANIPRGYGDPSSRPIVPDHPPRGFVHVQGAMDDEPLELINDWLKVAGTAEEGVSESAVSESAANKTLKVLFHTQNMLDIMKILIADRRAGDMFALVAEGGSDSAGDIQSIALAAPKREWDTSGRLAALARRQGFVPEEGGPRGEGGWIETLAIKAIVASPEVTRRRGVGAELIRRVAGCAAASGQLVTLAPFNPELKAYYERLGFEAIDGSSPMVYRGDGLYTSSRWQEFSLITRHL
mmetsp:Transcript_102971/g.291661  ORF Transcript_102971/g.291661 Transcript_102971/m.291661 type:complete len:297 (-) Transcript_102971:127-1017(-)